MPYIDPELRPPLDKIVEIMKQAGVRSDGKLNYILFKLCKDITMPSYNNYKNYIGELEECIAEIRRRILGPYEDEKCKLNGDVI